MKKIITKFPEAIGMIIGILLFLISYILFTGYLAPSEPKKAPDPNDFETFVKSSQERQAERLKVVKRCRADGGVPVRGEGYIVVCLNSGDQGPNFVLWEN